MEVPLCVIVSASGVVGSAPITIRSTAFWLASDVLPRRCRPRVAHPLNQGEDIVLGTIRHCRSPRCSAKTQDGEVGGKTGRGGSGRAGSVMTPNLAAEDILKRGVWVRQPSGLRPNSLGKSVGNQARVPSGTPS